MTKVYDEIEMFKNGPGSDLSGNQVRDKLTEIAMKVLEENNKLGSGPKSQAFGEFRSRLTPDPKGNGGSEMFNEFKHCSMSPSHHSLTRYIGLANSVCSQDRATEWDPRHCKALSHCIPWHTVWQSTNEPAYRAI